MTAVALAALVKGHAVGRNRFLARCPAHPDRSPSLSIAEGANGRVLLHCFAGCSLDAILAALSLSMSDFFQEAPPSLAQLIEAELKAAHHG
jgi:DNA primase